LFRVSLEALNPSFTKHGDVRVSASSLSHSLSSASLPTSTPSVGPQALLKIPAPRQLTDSLINPQTDVQGALAKQLNTSAQINLPLPIATLTLSSTSDVNNLGTEAFLLSNITMDVYDNHYGYLNDNTYRFIKIMTSQQSLRLVLPLR
jgi:hypothetical protein